MPETAKKSNRLITLDILRGLFLLVIVIDHVELYPSFIDIFSGRGRMWISAAEGFFFISGLLVGYIYRRKLSEGFLFVWKKIWRRAAVLYFWAVALTLLYTFLAQHHANEIKYGLDTSSSWMHIIWQTMTLRYTFGWADFLQHYVVFMLAAPFVIYLLSKRLWWLVIAASFVIWFNRGQNFVFAWQTIFYGGLIVGFYWQTIQDKIANLSKFAKRAAQISIFTTTAVVLTASWLGVYILTIFNDHFSLLSPGVQSLVLNVNDWNEGVWEYFEKWTMEPGRMILFLLTFITMYIVVERYRSRVPKKISGAVILLGANSLFVYGTHSLIIFILHSFIVGSAGLWWNFVITVVVLAAVIGITWLKVNWSVIAKSVQSKSHHISWSWPLLQTRIEGE